MKTKINKLISIFISFFIFVFTSCNLSVNNQIENLYNEAQSEKILVSFGFNESNERTVLPKTYDLTKLSNINLIIRQKDKIVSENNFADYNKLSSFKKELEKGTYSFSLTAFYSGTRTVASKVTSTVNENNKTVNFNLSFNANTNYSYLAQGAVDIKIVFVDEEPDFFQSEDIEFINVSVGFWPVGDTSQAEEVEFENIKPDLYDNHPCFSIELENRFVGDYEAEIILAYQKINSELTGLVLHDTVSILENQTSEKVYEINSEDFQPLYYITYNYKYSVNGEPYDNGLPEGFTLQADSFTLPYFTAYGYKLDYSLGNNTYKCTWYEDPELTIPAHDASFGESVGNKQLYAKWELHGVRSITVFKEGEQTPIKVEFTFPYNVTTQKIDKEVGKKEGFLNVYFFDKECKNNVNNLVLDEENIDLYLKQIEIEHKISTNNKLELVTNQIGISGVFKYEPGVTYDNLFIQEKDSQIKIDALYSFWEKGEDYTFFFPFTQPGEQYTFTYVYQDSTTHEWNQEDITITAGGGVKLLDMEKFNGVEFTLSSTDSYAKLSKDIYPIFIDKENIETYKININPVLDCFSGDKTWQDSEWVNIINLSEQNYQDLLDGMNIDSWFKVSDKVKFAQRQKWFINFKINFVIGGVQFTLAPPSSNTPDGLGPDCYLYNKSIPSKKVSIVSDGVTIDELVLSTNSEIAVAQNYAILTNEKNIYFESWEKEDYYFNGLYFDDKFENEVTDNFILKEDTNLYIKWTKYLNVNLNLDGGTFNNPIYFDTVQVKNGINYYYEETRQILHLVCYVKNPSGQTQRYDFLYAPRKELWVFDGWYFDSERTQPLGTNVYSFTEDTTLYAKFTETRNVTFELDGGTLLIDNEVELNKVYINDDATYFYSNYSKDLIFDFQYIDSNEIKSESCLPKPQKDGMVFVGWYFDEEGNNSLSNLINEFPEGNVVLYAQYKEPFKVNLILNGGNLNGNEDKLILYAVENNFISNQIGYLALDNFYESDMSTIISLINNPTKDSKIFTGWYTDETFLVKFNSEKDISEELTLYAKWENPVTIHFETNGGNLYVDNQYDFTEITEVVVPVNTTLRYDDNYKHIDVDFALYFGFTNPTGGRFGYQNPSLKAPIKEGFTFNGWYLNQELTDPAFSASGPTLILTENITLYASWSAAE